VDGKGLIQLNPLTDETGKIKAQMVQFAQQNTPDTWTQWIEIKPENNQITLESLFPNETNKLLTGSEKLNARFKNEEVVSGIVSFGLTTGASAGKIWEYILWFTAMVGFWATMAISISDITRFAVSQKAQVSGQFIGLPGTMIFYSFVGIFVTSASIVIFKDVLIAEDAPWDPVSLVAKFKNPAVIILAQIAMLLATLSTNIAANVIAPANAFSNLIPQKISFKYGGLITGLFGILICPWWLMDEISSILIFVSGLLGPVLAILICDYFLIRKTNLSVSHLYDPNGEYAYGGSGINSKAILALLAGILAAVAGLWIPALSFLYSLSWFTGFAVSFLLYYLLMAKSIPKNLPAPQ
jgi:NCS1 nucleoside transporter family